MKRRQPVPVSRDLAARHGAHTPRGAVAVVVGLGVAFLAGCGGPAGAPGAGSPPAESDEPTSTGSTPTGGTAYPLTVETCGVASTLAERPERIVAIKSSAAELVLALGAGDRLAGTAFLDGPIPTDLAPDAQIPSLADKVPSSEVVLAAEPDLVMAGWESALTAEGAGDRATLDQLGVATWVSPAACRTPGTRPGPLTADDVLAEITQVGELLDTQEAAATLVAQQREAWESVTRDERGLTALWYSSGTDVPYVGAGSGAPALLLDAVGLENIAGDVDDTWTSFSWEQVVADDPDVLVLVDAAWNSAEQKKALLAADPTTARLTAVREERYLVVPFAATEVGVRTLPAAVDLAAQLAALPGLPEVP